MKKIIIISFLLLFIWVEQALAVNIYNPAPGLFVNNLNDNTFGGILLFFVNLLLNIVGVLSVAFIIIGGFQYITSNGDEERASAGKRTLFNAIIGLVIVIVSLTLIAIVQNALQGRA